MIDYYIFIRGYSIIPVKCYISPVILPWICAINCRTWRHHSSMHRHSLQMAALVANKLLLTLEHRSVILSSYHYSSADMQFWNLCVFGETDQAAVEFLLTKSRHDGIRTKWRRIHPDFMEPKALLPRIEGAIVYSDPSSDKTSLHLRILLDIICLSMVGPTNHILIAVFSFLLLHTCDMFCILNLIIVYFATSTNHEAHGIFSFPSLPPQ
jgi:hypothetical protein